MAPSDAGPYRAPPKRKRRRAKIHTHRAAVITTGKARSEINVTPLGDVVLVLLIIFMVMRPTLLKEMDVTVREKADVQVAMPQTTDQIVVSVSRETKIAITHEPIAEAALTERIHDLMASRTEK